MSALNSFCKEDKAELWDHKSGRQVRQVRIEGLFFFWGGVGGRISLCLGAI